MKIVKRILIGLLGVLLGLILLLAASIVVDGFLGRERIEAVTNTTIPGVNGGPDVAAFVAAPDGAGPFPVVILIHEFYGLNESIVGKAKGLAQEGYWVVAPDTFRGSTTAWISRAIFQVLTAQPERVNQDLDSVYAWIEAQPEVAADRTGIAGFCYGGRVSLVYSLHNDRLAATVIYYGSPETDPQILRALPGPVLGIFGGADPTIPLESVRAFEAGLDQAGIPNQITIYDGQPHAFVADIETIRAGGAAGEAWAQMLDFLAANLKDGSAAHPAGQAAAYADTFQWLYYLRLAYAHAVGSPGSHH